MNLEDVISKQKLIDKVKKFAMSIWQELEYVYYGTLPDLYYSQVAWRIRYYWYHESCKNCRAWTYEGGRIKQGRTVMFGTCAWDKLSKKPLGWTSEFEYCNNYNELPYDDMQYTKLGDGWKATTKTPTGKVITVISRNGHWLYLHDGPVEQ